MKKINTIILLFLFVFNVGCEKKDNKGYNCTNGNCSAVFDNPQYLTLADCQSVCGSNSSGYNCVSGNCVFVDSNAQFSSLTACQSSCGIITSGYNCVSGNCVPVSSNAQFPNLSLCQSVCASPVGGVIITTSWTSTYFSCFNAYNVSFGLGYTSTDVANEAYFAQSGNYISTPVTYSKGNLAPGTYYYKAKKVFRTSLCGTGQGVPITVTKSGAFTIIGGQNTSINIGSLN